MKERKNVPLVESTAHAERWGLERRRLEIGREIKRWLVTARL
jgi:hypothetical protein